MRKRIEIRTWLSAAVTFGALCAPGWAANSAGNAVDVATRRDTIQAIGHALDERYTFPEVAREMARRLVQHLAQGQYDSYTNGPDFARRLTQDLRDVSHDKHLRVTYSATPLVVGERSEEQNPEQKAAFLESQRRENAGIDKVEILPGNIGYLHLNYFGIAEIAGPRIAGAMNFLAGTDALIVDIRNNSGAIDPGTIAILCSYFFPEGRTHLNSLMWREGNREEQSWTLPLLPGPRYLDRPVYVLTSGRTFSGAEEFVYNLQTRKRARAVGAKTGGGANPGGDRAVTEHFKVWIPTGRAWNPVTKTNWEGTGVLPDVEVKPAKALLTAQKLALDTILAERSSTNRWHQGLKKQLAEWERELTRPEEKVTFRLVGYPSAREVCVVGTFNDWTVGTDRLGRQMNEWIATVELEPGRHAYKLWVDGKYLVDPQNSHTEITSRGHTNSVIHVEASAARVQN